MTHHDLKCYKEFFQPIVDLKLRAITRKNDRGYQEGDTITLHAGESVNGEYIYTGDKVSARISYCDSFGLQDGYLSLSLSDVGLLIIK